MNIGIIYEEKGDLDCALKYFSKSEEITKKNFGENHVSLVSN